MMYVTGDTHGQQERFLCTPETASWTEEDILFICGDFGFIMRADQKESDFLDILAGQRYTICFIDGNHENFHALNQYPTELWNGGTIHRIRHNIIHLMRGQVYTIQGKVFFCMGGAYSRDRQFRRLGFDYWPEELPTSQEYHEAEKNLASHHYQVDYILTHTMPAEMIRRYRHVPDIHDQELTGFLEYIMYKVQYRHWYCGHWHTDLDLNDRFSILWFDLRPLVD